MRRAALAGLSKARLRAWLGLFFLALAVPTAALIHQAYRQLRWESYHQHRSLAEELAARIDARYQALVAIEEARSFADYRFLVVVGDPRANVLQRSPLAAFPPEAAIPGLIGYFQVDDKGFASTPLLPPPGAAPAAYGISADELARRRALQADILGILSENRLVGAAPPGPGAPEREAALAPTEGSARARRDAAPGAPAQDEAAAARQEAQAYGQAAFDRLEEQAVAPDQATSSSARGRLGNVAELKLESAFAAPRAQSERHAAAAPEPLSKAKRLARREQGALPEPAAPAPGRAALAAADDADGVGARAAMKEAEQGPSAGIRVAAFESEIDPPELSLLDSGHFVLFRKVWRDGKRYVQGALIARQPFLRGVVAQAFREGALARVSDLAVAYRGAVFDAYSGSPARAYLASAEELSGALLYRTRLSAPLGDLELVFTVTRLPAGPGAALIAWLAAVLALVLGGGFLLMYRLGTRQIELARQQQDFVSAVSHELKTPLTSIRMYGEMLREGWVSEDKKREYYDFIHAESERLSRLIANVLQLARMTRNDLDLRATPASAAALLDAVRSKTESPVARAGFELHVACTEEAADAVVEVDADAFAQIVINLVDNALKFAARAQPRRIEIGCHRDGEDVVFTVRDHGPGIARDHMKKIFRLFYRAENELTRETVGTGIGLALVHQLTRAMGGKVDVVNRDPGAEFRVALPASRSGG